MSCLFYDLARGAKDLHNANIMHRDIKPDNSMVIVQGRVSPFSDWKGILIDYNAGRFLVNG